MNLICKITDNDFGYNYSEPVNPRVRLASRGIVLRSDGKIAVFNKSNKNEYKLPGGGRENDESPEETFKREVLEETGCEVDIIEKLGIVEEYISFKGAKQISHVFVAKVIDNNHKLGLTEKETVEGANLIWVSPQEAIKLIEDSYAQLTSSTYDKNYDVYRMKFISLRDKKILEYYISNYKEG